MTSGIESAQRTAAYHASKGTEQRPNEHTARLRHRKDSRWLLPLAFLLYVGSAVVRFGHPTFDPRLATALGGLGLCLPVLALVWFRLGSRLPWRVALERWTRAGWPTDRLLRFAVAWAILPLFFWAFAAWKTAIPPFTWDARLAALDFPHPYVSLATLARLDGIYWSWNYVLVGLMLWKAWSRDDRFWWAFLGMWVGLGTGLAHLVPSAGPIFTDPTVPVTPDLAWTRDYLWSAVSRGEIVLGGGISAFPSLHVAVPVLGACASRGVLRWAFVGFAGVIWVSSVALGFHYWVDGLASIVLVPGIWWLARG